MREIVLDTETTGLDPAAGHRIVEIGCLELINHIPTERIFHRYLNPDMEITADAVAVHGLTNEMLAKHPSFSEIVEHFLEFIADAPLIIHNAEFDMKFLNAELTRHGFSVLASDRAVCTLKMTRKKYPGAPASLDALCQRFSVDNSGRTLHGALLDAQLLAECYIELLGGRQAGFSLEQAMFAASIVDAASNDKPIRAARAHNPTDDELAAHAALLAELSDALWLATG